MVQPHSRQSFDQVGQRGGNPLADACPALGHGLSVFGQQATQSVDLRGAGLDLRIHAPAARRYGAPRAFPGSVMKRQTSSLAGHGPGSWPTAMHPSRHPPSPSSDL